MQLNGRRTIHGSMTSNICGGCDQPIKDKYLLKAVEQVWHEDCLKCSVCDCCLGEIGSSLFVKANLLLCKQDYLRLFGMSGECSACHEPIPAFEMVMRAREHVYHLECFACQQCKLRFCVGDKFYLYGTRIVCEDHCDEEQREGNSQNTSHNHNNADECNNNKSQCNNLGLCNNNAEISAQSQFKSEIDGQA